MEDTRPVVNFVSYSFLVLFLTSVAGRLLLGRRKVEPAYVALLLVLSLVFYGWHVPVYLAILLGSAAVDYVAALSIARLPSPSVADAASNARRRRLLIVSLTVNLGLLGFFKYANFGIDTANEVMAALGVPPRWGRLDLVLPMGISFYTFQSMSYTIDVYRGVLAPIHSFWRFLLFIAFFPQLVAGPIVRATEFIPQLAKVRRLHLPVVNEGLFLIVSGFFLKVVCADNLADIVDAHWERGYQPGANGAALVLVTLLFSGQIFCDFAGYSNIARGTALLLGFRLPLNFNAPYIATSFKNFWERWHMTLSRWLRDYLYVSLGGNRGTPRRTYVNLLLTMLLGGLWHGAAFTFIVWGALHGGALALERALGLHRPGQGPLAGLVRGGWFLVVQVMVLVTWIFFRSATVGGAWQFLRSILAWNLAPVPHELLVGTLFLVPVVLLHLWQVVEERGLARQPGPIPKGALAAAMTLAIILGYGSANDFIYFQF
jgi:alginate O-acetyltransferase complex protein AlgI